MGETDYLYYTINKKISPKNYNNQICILKIIICYNYNVVKNYERYEKEISI